MNTSINLYRDVATGLFWTIGKLGFMSGEFVISSILFSVASISSNLDINKSVR
jgi:hypothetical protein